MKDPRNSPRTLLVYAAISSLLTVTYSSLNLVTTLQLPISTAPTRDACGHMLVSSNELYHMQKGTLQSILDKWDLTSNQQTPIFTHSFPFEATHYNS